jgi:putative transposase
MARPLRLEFAGAVYHLTSRRDMREAIFLDDDDRREWLAVLALVCERFNWVVHAYCQMTNHDHLLVETIEGNLSAGMRQLNGLYTQRLNRWHGMVQSPEDWEWSSYPFVISASFALEWLDIDWLLEQFGTRRATARRAYTKFVLQGRALSSPLLAVKHPGLLGDDAFVKQHHATLKEGDLRELSIAHKRILALSLAEYSEQTTSRNEVMVAAYRSGAYNMAEITAYFSVHYMTVSRAVRGLRKIDEGWNVGTDPTQRLLLHALPVEQFNQWFCPGKICVALSAFLR